MYIYTNITKITPLTGDARYYMECFFFFFHRYSWMAYMPKNLDILSRKAMVTKFENLEACFCQKVILLAHIVGMEVTLLFFLQRSE